MRKKIKKDLTYVLSAVLILGLFTFVVPNTAIRAEAAITKSATNTYLGSGILADDVNTANAKMVYFDSNGDTWFVIGYNGTGVASNAKTATTDGDITLLATGNMGLTKFDESGNKSNIYADSTLKTKVEEIADRLTAVEENAVKERDLATDTYKSNSPYCDGVLTTAVDDALMWPLSTNEAYNVDSILRRTDGGTGRYWAINNWWLRSPGPDIFAACVLGNGYVSLTGGDVIDNEFGVRPALNLNLSSILFTSIIPDATNGDKYKLTIINPNLSATVTEGSNTSRDGSTITVPYTVSEGTNRVTVLITDKAYTEDDANIKYYGSLSVTGEIDTSGSGTFTLPNDYVSTDKIYLIAETVNDDNKSDYASTPLLITIPGDYTVKFDANGGTGTMLDQARTYGDGEALSANAFTYEGRTFNGWNTKKDGKEIAYADKEKTDISSVNGDTITLYAQWSINTFTITWKNYDGSVLETDADEEYGTIPSYDGEIPVRAQEGNKEYTFSGWTPEIDTVKGAATYTATYNEKKVETTEPEEPEVPEDPEEEIPEKDWLDDLRLALRIADELGDAQTVEYSGDFALSYDIMNYLVEHPSITFIYHVKYEDVEYTIIIPAGKAVSSPEIPWYGPLWLLANYGNGNVPKVL